MPSDRAPPVVLVADDEPSTLAMVAAHVRSKGFKVLEASDGDQAWQLAHEHLPDLVVLDVMMPGMSGWEVCRKIREAVSLAHTGVVMLTGIGENLNEMTSPLYGADAYLDKPFEFSGLDEKIKETLARRRREHVVGRPDHADQQPASGAAPTSAESPSAGRVALAPPKPLAKTAPKPKRPPKAKRRGKKKSTRKASKSRPKKAAKKPTRKAKRGRAAKKRGRR